MKEVSTISKRKSRSRPQNRRQQPRPVNKGYGDAGASWHKKATKGFRAMSGSPKEDIDANNATLRQRARMLYMAAPIATSAIKTNRTNVIGVGLKLQSRIDREALGMDQEAADLWQAKTEREFALWANRKAACDATGVNNFYAMQQLALASWLVSGDVFAVVKIRDPDKLHPYGLRLHLVEADRVSTPDKCGGLLDGVAEDDQKDGECLQVIDVDDTLHTCNNDRVCVYVFTKVVFSGHIYKL